MRSLWFLALAALGCARVSSEVPTPPDVAGDADVAAPLPTVAAACTVWAASVCERMPEVRMLRAMYANASACRAAEYTHCVSEATLPGVVDLVPAIVRCTKARWPHFRSPLSLSCGEGPGVVRGTLPEKTPCLVDEQCSSGHCMHAEFGTGACGVCTVPADPGSPCEGGSIACLHIGPLLFDQYVCDPWTHA